MNGLGLFRSSQSPVVIVPVGWVLRIEVAGDVPLSYWNSTVLLPRMRAEMNEKPALKPVEVGASRPSWSCLSPPPSPEMVWVPGHWVSHLNGYAWIAGAWR